MGDYIWPCPDYARISCKFGNGHLGLDMACASGRAILATKAGTIVATEFNSSYGNYVLIDHGGGLKTRYAHASKLLYFVDDKVAAGEKIALVGSTGNSTGPHLHFEVIVNGVVKNPLNYVSDKDTVANFTGEKGGTISSGIADQGEGKNKDITDILVTSIIGRGVTSRSSELLNGGVVLNNGCEIIIQNDKAYLPIVEGDITLETERKDVPGKLSFNVVKDGIINFQEGNPVRFRVNGQNMFYGFVFSKKRSDDKVISVTCYDQLRYLKNKDTIVYKNKKYSDLIRMLATDFNLNCGNIDDTKYVISSRIEEDTLFDILGYASDQTLQHTGKIYVLFDDYGKLSLKSIESMLLPIVVCDVTAGSYDYESSLDKGTANKVKLAYDNQGTGTREVIVVHGEANQKKWGILQYYDKYSDEVTSPREKAQALLKYYDRKSRTLSVSRIKGDTRVRAGNSLLIKLGLGDINVSNYMVAEKVKHTFSNGDHYMDISFSGIRGEFSV